MSFTKTISTIAALASVFGTSVLAYRLVQAEKQTPSGLEEKITQLEKQLEEAKSQRPVAEVVQPTPQPAPQPVILPEATPPPPVPEE
jgi:hypothetical protein